MKDEAEKQARTKNEKKKEKRKKKERKKRTSKKNYVKLEKYFSSFSPFENIGKEILFLSKKTNIKTVSA